MIDASKLNVVDLFCGSGGISLGFKNAGFNIALGVDINDSALDTYKLNFGNEKGFKSDLFKTNCAEILKRAELEKKNLTVLVGCPPMSGV